MKSKGDSIIEIKMEMYCSIKAQYGAALDCISLNMAFRCEIVFKRYFLMLQRRIGEVANGYENFVI